MVCFRYISVNTLHKGDDNDDDDDDNNNNNLKHGVFIQLLHVTVEYGREAYPIREKANTLYCRALYNKILPSSMHMANMTCAHNTPNPIMHNKKDNPPK
jgi:hypothetical protein